MRVLFAGGGTGGHIFPIIAVCRELKKLTTDQDFKFFYVGPKDEISSLYLPGEGIKIKYVLAGKIRRYFGIRAFFQNIVDIFKIPIGVIQAFFYIFAISPDLIFSKGGYGSIPAVLAGWMLGTPIFLHESDAVPGFSNKFLGKYALQVFISFPLQGNKYFSQEKMISTGNPIREEILNGSKEEAKETFHLTGEKPVVLIIGGSQGCQRINEVVLEILPELLSDFEIIHQCGKLNFEEVSAESTVASDKDLLRYYHVFPFLEEKDLANAYRAADLIISRAGAGSIFEIAAVGKPSILVPLPEAAQDHQLKNAYDYAENGACLVLEEAILTPNFFLEKIRYLFGHSDEMEKMAGAAVAFARPKTAEVIASYLSEYLKL